MTVRDGEIKDGINIEGDKGLAEMTNEHHWMLKKS